MITLFLMFLSNRIAYEGGRFLGGGKMHWDLSVSADSVIPFLPWTIIIYFGCFLWWAWIYLLMAYQKREEADRFFGAFHLAHGICFIFFVLLPTANTRPALTGSTIWINMMRFLYHIDAPDNLFPSIQCMISWLCWIGTRNNRKFSAVCRYGSLLMALLVCISTLTTRQHVLADVAGGILLSEFCYGCFGIPALKNGYALVMNRLVCVLASPEKRCCNG